MTAHIEDLTARIKPKTASNVLLWAVAGFFAIFLVWAGMTELDRTVRGIGRVIPSSQLQVVSNLEGGIVEAIRVQPGQIVAQGDELVRLDQTQTGAELGSGSASAAALTAKIARLQAEITGREPVYPAASNRSVAEQIEIERSLHAARMSELASLQSAANARIGQAQNAVAEAQSAYQARITARDARRAEVNLLRPLVEKGIEPRLTLTQAESAAAIAGSEAASASAAIARTSGAVAEARSASAQQIQDWRATAAAELATAQAELAARRSTLPALAERVERTVVRSPLPGKINRVLVTTVGGSVAPGAPLVEIVPSEKSLLVEARVDPKDIASVRLNQRAKVNITAYDPAIYGGLEGSVVSISPDAVVDPETGESFYVVRVRTVTNAIRDQRGRAMPIGPGMIAEVNLLGDKRTVLQYILNPITRLGQTAFRE